jgi:tetratricopeptide (TPR) repeat protein
VAGFPAKTSVVNAYLYRFKEGKITANANIALDDGYALVYSNNTAKGMSGGPVLNEAGEVIGVHGKAETVGQEDVIVPTGDNLGIPIKTFLTIPLVDVGVRPPKVTVAKKPKADDFFLQGTNKLDKKDYPGALQAYTEAIKLNSKYTQAYLGRGIIYIKRKQYAQALADFNQVVKIEPNLALSYIGRGLVYNNQKKYPEALADLNQALKLDPNSALAYKSRGDVYYDQKKYPEALADYNQAIKLDPNLAAAYNNRGELYRQQKKYSEALADFNQAIKLDPNLAVPYGGRADLLTREK